MNIERLKKLSAHLKSLDRKTSKRRFDMEVWVQKLSAQQRKKYNCRTAACALGEAGHIPAFRRQGLKSSPGPHMGDVVYTYESGYKCHGLVAAQAFFGLTYGQARTLFIPRKGHRTPKQVARCIDTLVTAVELFRLQSPEVSPPTS